ncbi:HD-GYP domain-containing protein [Oceanobacillus manasiensis]|uniref:HD-GYP domain-containing protein n=1 Tax=Oceanobacillus manasiensis TaxID=586413 RepID=UPI0005AA1912|nr:HD-GYP domain-containing protein [Oceanobacillus manasiensis]
MRIASTKKIHAGTILAQTIYNENGAVLIKKGMKLTEKLLRRLLNNGITYIYIEDGTTSDIKVDQTIPDKLRIEATNMIKDTFTELQEVGLSKRSYIIEERSTGLKNVVEKILGEIQQNEKSLSLLADIFVSDNYVFQHSLNVTIYSLAIGVELNFSKKQLAEIGVGAMLHDIGKMFIDPNILQKPDKLTDEEFEIIKGHTQVGFDYLRKHPYIPTVISHCAFQHHERLDGSGYPRGIQESEIHPYAKVIGIADVFDAVTSSRVYRDAMLPHEGLEILYAGAVNLFDKEMIEAFKRSVVAYPNGLTIELSDGRIGVVIRQNSNLCDRPVVRILEENETTVDEPYEVDLEHTVNVTIKEVLVE